MEPGEFANEAFRLNLRSQVTGASSSRAGGGRLVIHMELRYLTSGCFFAPRFLFPMAGRICEPEVEDMLLQAFHDAPISLDAEIDQLHLLVYSICCYCNTSFARIPVDAVGTTLLHVFANITVLPTSAFDAAIVLPTSAFDAAIRRSLEEGGGGRGPRSAAASAIENLEKVTFRGEVEATGAISNCVICLEDFEPATEITVMPCGHRFHCRCLTRWLGQSYFCPLCRLPLQRDD